MAFSRLHPVSIIKIIGAIREKSNPDDPVDPIKKLS